MYRRYPHGCEQSTDLSRRRLLSDAHRLAAPKIEGRVKAMYSVASLEGFEG
jgi:hypothetical protein